MRFVKENKKRLFLIFILSVTIILAFGKKDYYKEVSESLGMLNTVYKQLFYHYADELKPEEFTEAAIKGMVKELDPYTVFMVEEEKESVEMLSRGKYGGVGIRISMRKDTLTAIAPMDNTPAQRAGILPGDQILKVDSLNTVGLTLDEAAKHIRGKVNSKVTLVIKRPGIQGTSEYTLTRANIRVEDISYYGLIDDDIGYIRVTGFSNGVTRDLTTAIESMKTQGELNGLVLDLRGNPGGLLQEALKMAELFTNPGDTLLFTKGRTERSNQVFIAKEKPIIPDDVELAVLINRGSASASEIVSGIIQDTDRGVVLGQPSFGKGLVQTVLKLDKNHSLKITNAKYYIPSGRLIQKEGYINNDDVVLKPENQDTLFYSKNGRKLHSSGGITPDIGIKSEKTTDYVRELWRQNKFYSFAIHYKSEHGEIPADLEVNRKLLKDFKNYLDEHDFNYQEKEEKSLHALEKKLGEDEDFSDIKDAFSDYYKVFEKRKTKEFENNKDMVSRALESEMAMLSGGLKHRVEVTLDDDPVVLKAVEILKNSIDYEVTLGYKQ